MRLRVSGGRDEQRLGRRASGRHARAGASIPLRVTAVFRTARRLSEVEVATECRKPEFFSVANRQPTAIERALGCGRLEPLARSDSLDDARSSNARLDRHPDDPSAARLDDVAADDGVFGPVGALDEHVRLDRRISSCGVSSSKITTPSTHASAARISARSASGVIGRSGPLVRADRPIGIEADDQRVAERRARAAGSAGGRCAADRTRRW